MAEQRLDVICLGRSSVDLYGEQAGGRLEDVQTFAKYVGGCPSNIAIGTARLGLRSGLITRVGDEQLGRFIIETMQAEGVDTTAITVDPQRLTALVILGIRDRETFPHIFYRTDCADMAIDAADIDPSFVASSAALLVTGTHLSTPKVEAASRAAIAHARTAGSKVILDIDYRPVLWGLAGHAAGESRYAADPVATQRLQAILPDCDLVVGTEEEVRIAGGSEGTLAALRRARDLSHATIVLKRGPAGCVIFEGNIPDSLDDGLVVAGKAVEVFNTLGAGDGFMSGFLRGWLRHEPLERCGQLANAVGAIVVSRHGCSPAIPTWLELEAYLEAQDEPAAADIDRLHRVTTRHGAWTEVAALAFDHRKQLEEMADRLGQPRSRISGLKDLIAEALEAAADVSEPAGAIADGRYGADALARLCGKGWWLARPVEEPGSRPLQFEAGPNVGLAMRGWPRELIAKCLVIYDAKDPPELRARQEVALRQLCQACAETGREVLIEVIPPEPRQADPSAVPAALEMLYGTGIAPDWWKLPPAQDAATWSKIEAVIARHDAFCRGVVILGQNADDDALRAGFDAAADCRVCRGFAVGRSIFQKPAEAWLADEIDDQAFIEAVAEAYQRVRSLWKKRARQSPVQFAGSVRPAGR